jgi:SAM-dependent methyltransferase
LGDPFYDRVGRSSSLEHSRTQVALEFARSVHPRRVLDVGSDKGENSAALAAATGASVVCVDVSEIAIEACRQRGLEAHHVAIGDSPLPFSDGSFDLIQMGEVIEHLVHPDLAMQEARRVLLPGGHLILSTPNLACLPNRVLLPLGFQPIFTEVSEERVLGRRFQLLGQGGSPVGHLRIYTKRALVEFLAMCGYETIRVRGVAMHQGGILGALEGLASLRTEWAMILIVLARRKD